MKYSVRELPFNAFLGMEPGTGEGELLRLPAGEHHLNHLGTVHASALLALAEASSGECLLKLFGSSEGILPVVRRLEAKFRKPARGWVGAKAEVGVDVLNRMLEELAAKGRTLVTVPVELHDQSGAHVLSAAVEWFVQRLQTGDGNP